VSVYRRTRPIEPKNPASRRVPYGRWYIRLSDHLSIDQRIPAYASKSATVELEHKLRRLVEVRRGTFHAEGELATFLPLSPRPLRARRVGPCGRAAPRLRGRSPTSSRNGPSPSARAM
jgi:hypothetical protein